MKRASVSETKNNLSRLLDEVKRGETVVVTDRNRPVAQIIPFESSDPEGLLRDGIVSGPAEKLDVAAFLDSKGPALPEGVRSADVIRAERDEGR